MNTKLVRSRQQAIKAVMEAMLPEFLNRVFLRMIGLLSVEPPKMIEYTPNCVHLGSKLDILAPLKRKKGEEKMIYILYLSNLSFIAAVGLRKRGMGLFQHAY